MRTLDSEELKLVYGGGGDYKDDCKKKHKYTSSRKCSSHGKGKGHKKHHHKHSSKCDYRH